MYEATLAGRPVNAVIDSFASHNFMSYKDAVELGIDIETVKDLEVELGNGSKAEFVGEISSVLNIEGHLSTEDIYVIHMHEENLNPLLILGRMWLEKNNPAIDWKANTLTFTRPDGTRHTIKAKTAKEKTSTTCFKMMSFRKLPKAIRSGKCELYAVQ